MPPSSLEPRTVNQNYPFINLFPSPPLGRTNEKVETPLQKAVAIVHAARNCKQLAIDLKQALWSQIAATKAKILATLEAPAVRAELRRGTHWTPTTLPHPAGLLDINGCIPQYILLDTEAVTSMFSKAFATAISINVNTLTSDIPFLTARGALEEFMGVTKEVNFTLARGTPLERRKYSKATVVDTTAYCALLGMDFVARVGGVIDTCDECGPTIDCQQVAESFLRTWCRQWRKNHDVLHWYNK